MSRQAPSETYLLRGGWGSRHGRGSVDAGEVKVIINHFTTFAWAKYNETNLVEGPLQQLKWVA